MCYKKKIYEVTDFGGMEKKRHSLDMESSIGDVEMVGDVAPSDRFRHVRPDKAPNDSESDNENDNENDSENENDNENESDNESESDNENENDNNTKHYPMARMIYVAEMDVSD